MLLFVTGISQILLDVLLRIHVSVYLSQHCCINPQFAFGVHHCSIFVYFHSRALMFMSLHNALIYVKLRVFLCSVFHVMAAWILLRFCTYVV